MAKIVKQIPTWVFSWCCRTPKATAVGVKECIKTIYDDGTEISTPNLKIYDDPVRPFWVTLPQYRDHAYKKEFEDLNKCEKFLCHESELVDRVADALNLFGYRRKYLRAMCDSPYIYGADIDIQALIRMQYKRNTPNGVIPSVTRGALDIETSTVDGEIIAISFVHEHSVYTAVSEKYSRIYEGNDKFSQATEDDCLKVIDRLVGSYMKDNKFTLRLVLCKSELELIKWIFDRINECKTDLIAVWNIGFDIPTIINRLSTILEDDPNTNPEDIICSKEIDPKYRFLKFDEDKSNVQHFTDKWHWFTYAGNSQFYDAMCLYGRHRKVSGREPSYSLDAICNKVLGKNKLHFGAITNHWYAQNYNFLEYIAYNINDAVLTAMLEYATNDAVALINLSGISPLHQFSKQTVMLTNDAYDYGKAYNKIPASAGTNMLTEYDCMMLKSGGTVLPPHKATGVTVSVLEEYDLPSQVAVMAVDCDYSAMYPTTTSAFNISKETLLSSVIAVNGRKETVEDVFSMVSQPDINAVPLCSEYFNLPTYEEMDALFKAGECI